jgi:chromosomal replication initiation ATPase DnaA
MTRKRSDFDDLDIATKYIRAAYKLGGEDAGALNQVEFKKLTMFLVKAVSLCSNYQKKKHNPKSDYDIIVKVFDEYYPDWRKRGRREKVVLARYCLIYFLKEYTQLTLKEIGERVGAGCKKRPFDHTTVLHAIKTVNNMLETKNELYTQAIFKLESVIQDLLGITEVNEIENSTIQQEQLEMA